MEGLVLTVLLGAVRPDFRIGANSLLSGVDAMRNHLIPMNPFETHGAMAENCRALRKCLDWLAGGGLLAMFPAGEVAHLSWTEHAVTDPPWKETAARMALRARCPVIPVFFHGANSLSFQLAGVLHPGLRTISLPREFRKLRRKTVQARIGGPIPPALLNGCGGGVRATEYLRSRTFFLRHRRPPAAPASRPAQSWEAAGAEAAAADAAINAAATNAAAVARTGATNAATTIAATANSATADAATTIAVGIEAATTIAATTVAAAANTATTNAAIADAATANPGTTIAAPTKGLLTEGLPAQGSPTGGLPSAGLPVQGLPVQGLPVQGLLAGRLPGEGSPGEGLLTEGLPAKALPAKEPLAAEVAALLADHKLLV